MKSKLLYHITHIDNLDSIIKQGKLWSHAQIKQHTLGYQDMANENVQSRRRHTKIPISKDCYLHDYVPFYFAPRSPMLYSLKMQPIPQNDIIYFMTSIKTIQNHSLDFIFTDAHAIRRLTNFYTDLAKLSEIDWDVMNSPIWKDTDEDPNRKARRQAEFLVYNEVPLSACLGFAVYSNGAKKQVDKILENNKSPLQTAVRRHFYF